MAHERSDQESLAEAREALRALQEETSTVDVDVLSTYPGEWIVIYKGRVVAHSKSAAELAREAPESKYPYSTMEYVPTLEQQAGVWILRLSGYRITNT